MNKFEHTVSCHDLYVRRIIKNNETKHGSVMIDVAIDYPKDSNEYQYWSNWINELNKTINDSFKMEDKLSSISLQNHTHLPMKNNKMLYEKYIAAKKPAINDLYVIIFNLLPIIENDNLEFIKVRYFNDFVVTLPATYGDGGKTVTKKFSFLVNTTGVRFDWAPYTLPDRQDFRFNKREDLVSVMDFVNRLAYNLHQLTQASEADTWCHVKWDWTKVKFGLYRKFSKSEYRGVAAYIEPDTTIEPLSKQTFDLTDYL